jgi:hypothetical protein
MQRVAPLVEQAAIAWEGEDGERCYGQIEKRQNRQHAQMCYLGCQEVSDPLNICRVLEQMVKSAGSWKAWGVLADLPESSPLFEGFRKAGFTIWARQNIYLLGAEAAQNAAQANLWRLWTSDDMASVNSLYKEVVPGLVQCIEPITRKTALGLVAFQPDGRLAAFADLEYGPKGVWVQVITSPDVQAASLLQTLYASIPELYGRPAYLSVRSYLPWLDATLEALGMTRAESQMLLVKNMVLRKALDRNAVKQVFEKNNLEGSLPITRVK